MVQRILIVDDDPVQRRLLEAMVTKMGQQVLCVEGGQQALDVLLGEDASSISLVFLDLVMPGIDGMDVMRAMGEAGINCPTIVQTAQGGIETAVKAMRAGAFDFVVKPVSPDRVKAAISNALKVEAKEVARKRSPTRKASVLTFDEFISVSPRMENVIRVGRKSANSNIPVLIEGESGVGKEMIARAIQGTSDRAAGNFVTVNCGALPENLVESILFGHEKGAFTGASEKHVGKFQEANGGTLFLDEVGELPLEVQVKLLRAIQEGEVDPVGSRKPVKVDIRLISATNKTLIDEVKAGNFREDLYYRLNVFPMMVPPLRERPEDIPELSKHFTRKIAREEGRDEIKSIDGKALQVLCSYDWPGNIRQLENAIFRAVVLCEGDTLTVEEFPQILAQVSEMHDLPIGTGGDAGSRDATLPIVPNVPAMDDIQFGAMNIGTGEPGDGNSAFVDEAGDILRLEVIEKEAIRLAIELYDGQMSKIARKLGIGRSTLYRKLRDYGLDESIKGHDVE